MKPRSILAILLIATLLVSCGAQPPATPPSETPTQPPTQQVEASPVPSETEAATATQAPQEPTATTGASQSAVPTLTPSEGQPSDSSVPMATPINVAVNCRFGPGTVFAPIGIGLPVGKSAQIVGKNGDFWQIMNPDGLGDVCWVAKSTVTTSGDLSSIPLAPAPKASVTDVTVSVDPIDDNTSGCSLPTAFRYTGTITVNGPLTVTWHWASSKNTVNTSLKTTIFDTAGSYSFANTITVTTSGYAYVNLIVTGPGKTIGEGTFKVLCK